ncbi:glycoside hydrolase family 15 protein [Nonomuraea ferruginea]|uniref:Glycoside hydrolase family 15 protein n=1 Tax=Nonomuraea ferruginea TaxID=46174 RepID=A0ABT4SSR0_9ACTN|nr:glycoside hydrolase family 15 protein [Nonomuraea ferruginea]MDA0640298.1 glycoside hydrolase family 15 protein [Nonomuraea ferruginea]
MLGYADAPRRAVGVRRADALLRATRTAWETWSSRGDDIGTGRAHVRRSALVLRGLMYDESGALVAAPTTSLPETIGGERNWDYRYTWHRDAALTVLALFRLGHADEGVRYMRFLLHECVSGSGRLRPMAGIRGEQEGAEVVLDHLEGYAGSRPCCAGTSTR